MTRETGLDTNPTFGQDDDSASATTASAQASDSTARPGPSRRRMLGGLASGLLAGGAAGLAGGIALGANSNAPQYTPAARQRFTDKTVLITGATSGIGAAAAHLFAAEGARVAFCGRREDRGRAVEREIRSAGGEATYFRADVRDEAQVRDFVDATVHRYGGLNVAFNNAGVTIQKKLHEYSAEEFDQVLHTNLRGTFLAIKYQVPHLIRAGGGTIVVTSSSNAIATDAARGAYTASKRGLAGLVQAAALDYAADNIRINTLIPGTTDTELVRRAAGMEAIPDDAWQVFMKQWAKSNIPGLGRLGSPAEIAAFALTLASDEHPYLTGAQLVIDGGKTAHA
ncbi:SDR family NAD(P)-dependent oxidoreductase [Nocardia sp. NPDC052001]|uniref:SDR family NAD(P)-dependent oxidoreductase n=1 Tax=Nocardia sp. NPDC052001 TaxID=3154853 RepID=UPI00343F6EFA